MTLRALRQAFPGTFLAVITAMLAMVFLILSLANWYAARQDLRFALEKSSEAERLIRLADERMRASRLLAPYSSELERLHNKMNAEITEGAVLSSLQSLARKSGARLMNFRMEERPAAGEYRVRAAYAEFQGGYAALRHLLAGVERLAMPALIGNAIMERDPNETRTLRATLEVLTFSRGIADAD